MCRPASEQSTSDFVDLSLLEAPVHLAELVPKRCTFHELPIGL